MMATDGWESWWDSSGDGFDAYIQGTISFNSTESVQPPDGNFATSMWEQAQRGAMERLSKDACFQRYSSQLQSKASDVILVTKQNSGKYSLVPSLASSIDGEDLSTLTLLPPLYYQQEWGSSSNLPQAMRCQS